MGDVRIVFHPAAAEEARGAVAWYAERDPDLGRALADQLDRALGIIAEAPATWPAFEGGTRRYFLHRFPYHVVYRELDATIQVIAVMHAKRRPGYWRGR